MQYLKIPSLLRKQLDNKYENQFYFFTSKYINELIYSVKNQQSIQFQDLRILHQEDQYLRRGYRFKDLNGHAEIEQRIKMVSKFYIDYNMLTSQMPLMLITGTKELFLKRQKRLKQLKRLQQFPQDNNQSLDSQIITNNQFSNFNHPSQYLRQLNMSLNDLMIDDQDNYLNVNDELDESVHDIYVKVNDQKQQIYSNENTSNLFSISNVDHLICDFADLDIEQAIEFYKEFIKTKNGSTIISELLEEQTKLSTINSEKQKQRNKSKQNIKLQLKSSFPIRKIPQKIQKQSLLNNYISIFRPKTKSKQKKNIQQKQNRYISHLYINNKIKEQKINGFDQIENEEEMDELMEKQTKKKGIRIRQKAEKLLEKIKRESSSTDFR